LIPLELPAVTEPPSRKAGRRAASLAAVVSGRGCSSRSSSGGRPALLGPERERVLVLPRDRPTLGHVLTGLAHGLEREPLGEARVREAPAEGGVDQRAVAARERRLRLGRHERRPTHRLDAAGDEEVAVPGRDRVAGADDRREP
jgi:hypothetical protein